MNLIEKLAVCVVMLREFIAPTYRPERHYMRGPGPAHARRNRAPTPAQRASAI